MSEARVTDEALIRALSAVGRDVAFPPTPSTAPAVLERLRAERAGRARPPFPAFALWSRRRMLAVVAVGVLAVLALAFAARLVLGAVEIRVQPGVTPSGPPLGPPGLGEPVPIGRVEDAVAFDLGLPAGPQPDEAFVFRTNGVSDAALLAWRADEGDAALPGTTWRMALIEVQGTQRTLVKDVGRFEDATVVDVRGREAFWIDAPHDLIVITDAGAETFLVQANVLIWTEAGITYRLETTLAQPAAIALAETVA